MSGFVGPGLLWKAIMVKENGCPKCGSDDVVFQMKGSENDGWHCRKCGEEWI